MDTIKQLMDEVLMFENDMQYIPVSIKKKGVNYELTFTLEIDKDIAESFEDKTTLNEIVAKFIEINTLSKLWTVKRISHLMNEKIETLKKNYFFLKVWNFHTKPLKALSILKKWCEIRCEIRCEI